MRLNKFLWNNFLESHRGMEWVDFFSDLESKYQANDKQLLDFLEFWSDNGLRGGLSLSSEELSGVTEALKELRKASKQGLIPKKISSNEDADKYFQAVGDNLGKEDDDDESLFTVDDIPRLSVALYCLYPKYFFPYYFYPNFYALKQIFDGFGIFMPPVPPRGDYDSRHAYYSELCKSLRDFWIGMELQTEHIPVFLYGFAPEVVDLKFPPIVELPKARNAWFVGGGTTNGDAEYLDKATAETQTFWTGNRETEVGDIIVMYCLAPRSSIHSIWRAIRPGGVEPFRGYYNTIWMGYPQIVKPLSLIALKGDDFFSELPLVKGNMQGINGRRLPKLFYERLVTLLKKNGTDIKSLPSLEDHEFASKNLKDERDVEISVVEPLLLQLGFVPEDWERQVSLRVGRTEKVIPDYLIHVSRNVSATVTADWIWEAKFSITSHAQLQKDFGQASSYARLVDARGVALISKEGVWISSRADNFAFGKARHWSGKQIQTLDSLNEIRAVAGKKHLSRDK